MAALPYWLIFCVPIVAVAGLRAGGPAMGAGMLLVFGLIPASERAFGLAQRRIGAAPRWMFDLPLLAWVPVQFAVQLYGLSLVLGAELSWWEAVLATATVGTVSGAGGINVAHELMHRKQARWRAAAEALMASVTYTHFCIEHVHGHHRHVATPRDPASSRPGESVYRFVVRSVVGGLRSAIMIERERELRRGTGHAAGRSRLRRYALTLVGLYAVLLVGFGPMAVAYWLGQSLVAIGLLEVINYIEHYGLQRRELEPGRYERVQPQHSWNASQRLTNWLLFNLQRHSDHHYLASRPYDRLEHHDDVPQLPAGYATMLLLALVPFAWRRVMDPRVAAWNERRRAASPATDAHL